MESVTDEIAEGDPGSGGGGMEDKVLNLRKSDRRLGGWQDEYCRDRPSGSPGHKIGGEHQMRDYRSL